MLGVMVVATAVGQPPGVFLDKDRFDFAQVRDHTPAPRSDQSPEEYRAYVDVLLQARRFSVADLEAAARRDVTFKDLVAETRTDFRFELIYFEGNLRRLRRVEPPAGLAEAGVQDLYEAWVQSRRGTALLCVLLTELPPGLRPALEYDRPIPVGVAGYFFKLLAYESDVDPQQRHYVAPLVMARSLTLLRPSAPISTGGGEAVVAGVVGLVGLVVVSMIVLAWYFRWADRAHRIQMDDRRRAVNPFDSGSGTTP
jgi:hypothetical protein